MKKILTLISISFLLLFLVGCSSNESTSDNNFVGSWQTSYDIDDNGTVINIDLVFTLNDDGTYSQTENATIPSEDVVISDYTYSGTYTVEDNTISFTTDEIDGKTKEEMLEEYSDADEDIKAEIESDYTGFSFGFTFEGTDKLELTNSNVTLEFTRVTE